MIWNYSPYLLGFSRPFEIDFLLQLPSGLNSIHLATGALGFHSFHSTPTPPCLGTVHMGMRSEGVRPLHIWALSALRALHMGTAPLRTHIWALPLLVTECESQHVRLFRRSLPFSLCAHNSASLVISGCPYVGQLGWSLRHEGSDTRSYCPYVGGALSRHTAIGRTRYPVQTCHS